MKTWYKKLIYYKQIICCLVFFFLQLVSYLRQNFLHATSLGLVK